jgi:hypothetical protein
MGGRASRARAHTTQTRASSLTRSQGFAGASSPGPPFENDAQSIPFILGSFHLRFGDGLGCPSPNRNYRDHGRRLAVASVASANLTRIHRTGRTRPATGVDEITHTRRSCLIVVAAVSQDRSLADAPKRNHADCRCQKAAAPTAEAECTTAQMQHRSRVGANLGPSVRSPYSLAVRLQTRDEQRQVAPVGLHRPDVEFV